MSRLESWVEAKRLAADLDSMNESLKKTTLATTGAKISMEQLDGSFKEIGALNGAIQWPQEWIASGALSYNLLLEVKKPAPIPPLKAPRRISLEEEP